MGFYGSLCPLYAPPRGSLCISEYICTLNTEGLLEAPRALGYPMSMGVLNIFITLSIVMLCNTTFGICLRGGFSFAPSAVLKGSQRFSKILKDTPYANTKNSLYLIAILTVPWVTPSISKSLYIFSMNPFGVPTAYLTRYHFMCIIALLRLIRDFKYLEGVVSTHKAHLFSYQP